jgi:uncharacterized membrane protein YcaP (DUF421 family)
MDTIIKAALVFFVLWAILRISGRRTLGQMTAFDFVLFLIIGGATQRALTGEDYSLINALLLVSTFVVLDVGLSLIETHFKGAKRVLVGLPMIVVENGKLLKDRVLRARVTEGEILEAARKLEGLERLDQIKFAVLEANGSFTIVPENGEARRS